MNNQFKFIFSSLLSFLFLFVELSPAAASATSAPLSVNLTAEGLDANELKVTWKKPSSINGAIVAYQVDLFTETSDSNAVSYIMIPIDAGNQNNPIYEARISYLSDGKTTLTNGKKYKAKVTVIDINSTRVSSDFTSFVSPYGAPNAPTGVSAERSGAAEIRVSWTSPPDNGSPVSNFKILCTPSCGSTEIVTSESSYVVRGLNPDKSYTFKVQAVNARDWSASSASSNAVIPFGSISATSSISLSSGDAYVEADWADIGVQGATISKYVAQIFLASSRDTPLQTTETNISKARFSGLDNGKSYVVRVVGYVGNVSGAQKISTTISPTTPTQPPTSSNPASSGGSGGVGAGGGAVSVAAPAAEAITGNFKNSAQIGQGSRVTFNSLASRLGMVIPAKSVVKVTVPSSSRKFCRVLGFTVRALKQGNCIITLTVTPPDPKPYSKSGTTALAKGSRISAIQFATLNEIPIPTGSKLTLSIARSSRKVCSVSRGALVGKSSGKCTATLKVQPPRPATVRHTATLQIN